MCMVCLTWLYCGISTARSWWNMYWSYSSSFGWCMENKGFFILKKKSWLNNKSGRSKKSSSFNSWEQIFPSIYVLRYWNLRVAFSRSILWRMYGFTDNGIIDKIKKRSSHKICDIAWSLDVSFGSWLIWCNKK